MNNYKEIITSLNECVTACETCSISCLEEKNVKAMAVCIKLNQDCSGICGLGVQLLARNSEFSESFIGLCVDICTKCAEECEKHDHEHCKRCARACRKCAEICKTYLDNIRQVAMDA